MRLFGRARGGGRRQAPREALPVAAQVATVQQTLTASVIDLSATGARLRAPRVPRVGEPVSLIMGCVRAFGVTAWAEERECGVEFDPPLPPFEIERLRREVRIARLTCAVPA